MSSDGYSDDDFTDESKSASQSPSKANSPKTKAPIRKTFKDSSSSDSGSSSDDSSSSSDSRADKRKATAMLHPNFTQAAPPAPAPPAPAEEKVPESNATKADSQDEGTRGISSNDEPLGPSVEKSASQNLAEVTDERTKSRSSSSSSSNAPANQSHGPMAEHKIELKKDTPHTSRSSSSHSGYGDEDFDDSDSDSDAPIVEDKKSISSAKNQDAHDAAEASTRSAISRRSKAESTNAPSSKNSVGSESPQDTILDDVKTVAASGTEGAVLEISAAATSTAPAPRGGAGRRGLLPPASTVNRKHGAPRELTAEEEAEDKKNRAFFLKQSRGKLDIYDPYKGKKFALNPHLKISNAATEHLTSRLYQPELLKSRTVKDLEQRKAEARVYNYDSAEDKHLKEFWRKRRAMDEAAANKWKGSSAEDIDAYEVDASVGQGTNTDRKDSLTLSFGSEPGSVEKSKTYPAAQTLKPNKHDTSYSSYTVPARPPPAPLPRVHKYGIAQTVEYVPPAGQPSTRSQGGAVVAVSTSSPNQPDQSMINSSALKRKDNNSAAQESPDEDHSLIKRQDQLRIKRERATQKGQMRAAPAFVVVFTDGKDLSSVQASEKYKRPLTADSPISSPARSPAPSASTSPVRAAKEQPIQVNEAADKRDKASSDKTTAIGKPTASAHSSRSASAISRHSSRPSSATSSSRADSYADSVSNNDAEGDGKPAPKKAKEGLPLPPKASRPSSASIMSHSNINAEQNRSSTPVESPSHPESFPTLALPPPVSSIRRKDLTALWMMAAPPPGMGGVRSLDIAIAGRSGVDLSWMAEKKRILTKFKEELPSPHRYGRSKYRLNHQHMDESEAEEEEEGVTREVEEAPPTRPTTSNTETGRPPRSEPLSRPASEVTNARINEANSMILTSPPPENTNSRQGMANAFTADILLKIMKKRTVAAESLNRMRNRKITLGSKGDSEGEEGSAMSASRTSAYLGSTNASMQPGKRDTSQHRTPSKRGKPTEGTTAARAHSKPSSEAGTPSKRAAPAAHKEKRYVPPIPTALVTLLDIPADIPDGGHEGADVTAEINLLRTLTINSPRSGIVLLRNGITLSELLPTSLFECMRQGAQEHAMLVAMERRYITKEAKRRRLLAKVREDYASVCAGISLNGLLTAFLDSDPSQSAGVSFAADENEVLDTDEAGDSQEGKAADSKANASPANPHNHPQALPMDRSAELLMKSRLERYDFKKARATRQQELSLQLIKERCDRLKEQSDQEKAFEKRRQEERERQAAERARLQAEREAKLAKSRQDAEDLDALNRHSILEKIQREEAHFERRRAEESKRKALEAETAKAEIRERQERVAQQERARQFELLCAADKARRKVDKVANAKALSQSIHKKLKDERDAMRRDELQTQQKVAAEVLAFRRSNDV